MINNFKETTLNAIRWNRWDGAEAHEKNKQTNEQKQEPARTAQTVEFSHRSNIYACS